LTDFFIAFFCASQLEERIPYLQSSKAMVNQIVFSTKRLRNISLKLKGKFKNVKEHIAVHVLIKAYTMEPLSGRYNLARRSP
jgi:hypothetical protein